MLYYERHIFIRDGFFKSKQKRNFPIKIQFIDLVKVIFEISQNHWTKKIERLTSHFGGIKPCPKRKEQDSPIVRNSKKKLFANAENLMQIE